MRFQVQRLARPRPSLEKNLKKTLNLGPEVIEGKKRDVSTGISVPKQKEVEKQVYPPPPFAKFLEVFKKLQINIPFAEALEQMPSYAKFMKGILSRKLQINIPFKSAA